MLYLLLRAVCTTLFAQLLRLGQTKRPLPLGVITVNYGVATLISLALAGWRGGTQYLPVTLGWGTAGGVAYIVSVLLMLPAMRRSGVSVAVAVLQLSILWPVAYGMLAFGERPSPGQWLGMAAAVAALLLLSLGRTVKTVQGSEFRVQGGDQDRLYSEPCTLNSDPSSPSEPCTLNPEPSSTLLLLLFLATGISGIAMKGFHEHAPARELPGFMAVLFAVATLGGALAMAGRRERLQPADFLLGAAVGLPNAAQLEFLLRALETLPALIVFPVSSALSLLFNAAAAMLCWGERPDRPTTLGLLFALAATFLLNRG